MSALTVTDTLSVPEALAVVRDILAQTDGDAVLLALAERVVGPLSPEGTRASLHRGILGRVDRWGVYGPDAARCWHWVVHKEAWLPGGHTLESRTGMETSREEADRQLCTALRRLGWHCVGAP